MKYLIGDIGNTSTKICILTSKFQILRTYNFDGQETVYIGTGADSSGQLRVYDSAGETGTFLGSGYFRTYNQFGKMTTYLGNGRDGGGYLRTNNKFETETSFLGTNNSNEGLINLNDKFGQSFWIRLNKGD